MMKRGVVPLALLAMLSGACIGGGKEEAPSAFSVTELTGAPQGRAPGGSSWRTLVVGEVIPEGTVLRLPTASDIVRVTRGEQIEIELRANESAADGDVAAEATIVSADDVAVQTGDVLARSEGAQPLTLRSADDGISASSSNGAFRLDRRVSLRIGVYTGTVAVSGPGGESSVARLREVQPRNGAPGSTMPLDVDEDDAWDGRFLGDVLDLDRDLSAQVAGYEGEFGARTSSVDDLAAIARDAKRDLGFVRSSLSRFSSGDVLVGVVLALLVEAAGGDDAPTAFTEMLTLRSRGASWGIIAADRRVDLAAVRSAVVRSVGLRTGVVTPGRGPSIVPSGKPTPRPSSTRSATTSPTRSPSARPSSSPSPRPSPSPSTKPPSPSPSPTPCSDVDVLLGNC